MVAHHKKGLVISDDVYLPVHVGREISNVDLGIVGDNTGVNISSKNPAYCEMTAMYWGWKNVKADYIGLCHYRRYFTLKSKPLSQVFKERLNFYGNRLLGNLKGAGSNKHFINQIAISDEKEFKKEAIAFSSQLKYILSENSYDLIVPTPYELSCRNVEQHFKEIGRDHIILLKEIVKEIVPTFNRHFEVALKSSKLYAANMLIAKAEYFNDYCALVFPILDEHLKRVVKNGWCMDPLKEKCYSRISGYLAELLTSAYIFKMKAEKHNIFYSNSMFRE